MADTFSSLPLKDIKDLPTLPSMASMAMAVAEDPSSTPSDLLRVIMTDPPTAARLLRVANSVHFNRGHEVSDLQTAIIRLGFANVRNLLMGVSVIRTFNAFFADAPYTREDFWFHCISVGTLASRMARADERLSSSTGFVAGLLHDLGKLVLDRYLRDAFTHSLRLAEGERISLHEAEKKRLGYDHAAVAGQLLGLWHFPAELLEPIRWHHDPDACPESHRLHAVLIQLADYLCNAHSIGYSGNPHPCRPLEKHLRALRFRDEMIDPLLKSLEGETLLAFLMPA